MFDRSTLTATSLRAVLGINVAGKTLDMIGTGAVGCSLARMGSRLRMTVLGFDLITNPDFLAAGGRYVDLDCLFTSADFLSLHIPFNDKTFHFIDAKTLARMKEWVVLINASRVKLVDELAPAEALASGKLVGASLEVFEKEPPVQHQLVAMESAVFTPHTAAHTKETLWRMDDACLATISTALETEP